MPFNHNVFLRISSLCLFILIWNVPLYGQIGTCEEAQAEALLEVGNIRARIYNNGTLFWKRGQNLYEAPKGSGLHSMFASTFVIGGLIDGDLHMSSSSYGPYEFWPGPLDEAGNPPSDCSQYDQIWEIRSNDFALYDQQGVFSPNMLHWPWELGAPVVDGDGNPDNYNLEGGDRPELLGDQTLWWIMNDRGNEHVWSEEEPIGLEVRASVYAFEHARSGGDITFYKYHITNKNTESLTDTYAGMWLDPDLGNASDDYIGSDSLLHLGYVYNGDPIDENGYENTPPALGYTFLLTPEAQIDEIDNNHNGHIDEVGETSGMYAATYFDGGGGIVSDPSNGTEMYRYLRGLWANGEPMTFGGYGLRFSNQVTRFFYTGDPVTGSYWTELQPFPNSDESNNPADRRFLVSSGPFTIHSGESKELLIALVWARGSNHLDSVRKLKNIVANMQATPDSYLTSGYRSEILEPLPPAPTFVLSFDQNYPNPFTERTTLQYSLPKTMQVRLAVYDILGREVSVLTEGSQEAGIYTEVVEGAHLPPGIYYARIELDHLQFIRKLVRIP